MPRALTLVVPVLLALPALSAGEPYRVGPGDVLEVVEHLRSGRVEHEGVATPGRVVFLADRGGQVFPGRSRRRCRNTGHHLQRPGQRHHAAALGG